ncbi:MAG TPA: AMP-binding protein [Verrucomicrobiae bacterium]|nr:AMP-binding protein [Verrucomicrobiae bacterium]
MNIAELILVQGNNTDPAIWHRNAVVTYGELREKVAGLARGLIAHGHWKGERAGIFSENSAFCVAAYLGIIRAGLTAVPFQTDVSAKTFSEIASNTRMKSVFVSNRFLARVRPWAHESGLRVWTECDYVNAWRNEAAIFPAIAAKRDLAALMFTSGSSGAPKGVMVSHRNIECNTLDIISYMELSRADRAMVVLPFYYCFGLSLLHSLLMVGGCMVLNNEFKLYPAAMLADLRQQQCTGFAGVPSTYQILLRRTSPCDRPFPPLRWLQQAGGKLPNACIQQVLDSFPQTKYFLMYGQTEGTARLSYLPPERLADKLGSIGIGLPSAKLEVLKSDGTPVAPGSEEIGEIVASGDNITLGYWNDPVETSKFFKQGKLQTGDIARVDAEGFIFLVDRERDMIKSGGNRISSKEVEEVIAELPAVIEVAAIGAPHDLLGEAIKAFVVPNPDSRLTRQQVEAHCRRRLPGFKVPQEVIFLKTMPHNGSGKILKRELKRMLERREFDDVADEDRPQPTAPSLC